MLALAESSLAPAGSGVARAESGRSRLGGAAAHPWAACVLALGPLAGVPWAGATLSLGLPGGWCWLSSGVSHRPPASGLWPEVAGRGLSPQFGALV